MGSFKEIDDFFDKLSNEFLERSLPNIVAEKATAFFKERFTTKEWDGQAWPQTKKAVSRGSLMVRSGALVNSIKPKSVTSEKVVISAGSDKVPYARIHNEGGIIAHPGGTPYFLDKKNDGKAVFVSKKKATEWATKNGTYLPITKPHNIPMPMRRFMGISQGLKDTIFAAIKGAFNAL